MSFFNILADSFRSWRADKAPHMGAALAYYSLFSFAPVLLLTLAAAGALYDRASVQQEILRGAHNFLGPNGAEVAATILGHANETSRNWLAALIALAILVVSASKVFRHLTEMFSVIWNIPVLKNAQGFWRFIKRQLVSLLIVLSVSILVFISLLLSAFMGAIETYSPQISGGLLETAHSLALLALGTLVIGVLFKILSPASLRFRDLWQGALLTSILLTVGKFLVGLYLRYESITSAYGAAGSLILLLFWIYCSAQIFLFGAEYVKHYARQKGSLKKTQNDS